ncbi:MAG TPA: DegT/DnrJ/EryC1/StrS family aminotransferase, partial [Deltaproteobacteria bacterium]|nr:DegT/DnrJ/EryC1/StrS family aminotransferase [Deltaproteobacteria bacterium]
WLMDVRKLDEYLATLCECDGPDAVLLHRKTRRPVRAVVPVHLYGLMVNMDAVLDLASRYGLAVIEDACQAHGARYYSKRTGQWETAGSMGHAAAFSFAPGRNLGACGDAGAVTTNSDDIASRVRMLRDHEQSEGHLHANEDCNRRLDALQVGFLTVKLRYLVHWNTCRRRAASWYKELLKNIDHLASQCEPMDSISACHLFVVRTAYRDRVKAFLHSNGIATGLHCPVPLHRQSCMVPYEFSSAEYPVAEKHAAQALSLPLFPDIRRDQVLTVCRYIREFYRTRDLAAGTPDHSLTA